MEQTKEHKEYLQAEFEKAGHQLGVLTQRVTVLEKALLHIVNSLDDTKQKSLRDKIKSNTKRTKS